MKFSKKILLKVFRQEMLVNFKIFIIYWENLLARIYKFIYLPINFNLYIRGISRLFIYLFFFDL